MVLVAGVAGEVVWPRGADEKRGACVSVINGCLSSITVRHEADMPSHDGRCKASTAMQCHSFTSAF
jgi:hypothetical protein